MSFQQNTLNNNQDPNIDQNIQNLQNLNDNNNRGILLAVMDVEFQEGVTKDLQIYQNDDPLQLATEFCQNQGLDENIIEVLVQNIQLNKQIAIQDLQKSSNYSSLSQLQQNESQNQLKQSQQSIYQQPQSQTQSQFQSQQQKSNEKSYFNNEYVSNQSQQEQNQAYEQNGNIYQNNNMNGNRNNGNLFKKDMVNHDTQQQNQQQFLQEQIQQEQEQHQQNNDNIQKFLHKKKQFLKQTEENEQIQNTVNSENIYHNQSNNKNNYSQNYPASQQFSQEHQTSKNELYQSLKNSQSQNISVNQNYFNDNSNINNNQNNNYNSNQKQGYQQMYQNKQNYQNLSQTNLKSPNKQQLNQIQQSPLLQQNQIIENDSNIYNYNNLTRSQNLSQINNSQYQNENNTYLQQPSQNKQQYQKFQPQNNDENYLNYQQTDRKVNNPYLNEQNTSYSRILRSKSQNTNYLKNNYQYQQPEFANKVKDNKQLNQMWKNQQQQQQSFFEDRLNRKASQEIEKSMRNWRNQNWMEQSVQLNKRKNNNQEKNMKENNENMTFTPCINPISEQIFKEKFKSQQSVHERLYKHAIKREEILNDLRQNQANEQMELQNSVHGNLFKTPGITPQKVNRSLSPFNVSERLYNKSKMKQDNLRVKREAYKQKQDDEELKECTYSPMINEKSKQLLKNKRKNNVQEELHKNQNVIQYKKERLKSVQMEKEAQQCTFNPEISYKSVIKAEKLFNKNLDQNEASDVYNRLYNNKLGDKYQEQKQQEYQQHQNKIFTFQPQIKSINPKLYDNIQNKTIEMSFIERQQQYQNEKTQKINEMVQQSQAQYDPITGVQYFKPQILSNSQFNKSRNEVQNVHEHLYKQRCKSVEKIINNQPAGEQVPYNQRTSINSEKILGNLKKQKFQEIFNNLDSDKDGIVSASKIDIKAVTPKILEIIAPVLYEMEEYQFTLTFQEFYDAVDRLLKTITVDQKAELLSYGKKISNEYLQNGVYNRSRSPILNKKSQKINQQKSYISPFSKQQLQQKLLLEKSQEQQQKSTQNLQQM